VIPRILNEEKTTRNDSPSDRHDPEPETNECIVDVSGVGYHLHIPFSTFEKLKPVQKPTFSLQPAQEDQFRLYGFHSEG
jgi:Holliday junction resolvasome RuvABC DNA-binding subunit